MTDFGFTLAWLALCAFVALLGIYAIREIENAGRGE